MHDRLPCHRESSPSKVIVVFSSSARLMSGDCQRRGDCCAPRKYCISLLIARNTEVHLNLRWDERTCSKSWGEPTLLIGDPKVLRQGSMPTDDQHYRGLKYTIPKQRKYIKIYQNLLKMKSTCPPSQWQQPTAKQRIGLNPRPSQASSPFSPEHWEKYKNRYKYKHRWF